MASTQKQEPRTLPNKRNRPSEGGWWGRVIRAMQRLKDYSRGCGLRPHTRDGSCFTSSEILPLGRYRCSAYLFRNWIRELSTNSLGSLATRRLGAYRTSCSSFCGHRILLKINRRPCTILILLLNGSSLCRGTRVGWTGWSVMGPLSMSGDVTFGASESGMTKRLTLLTIAWQRFIDQLMHQSVTIG
jgi:hypothetical protein